MLANTPARQGRLKVVILSGGSGRTGELVVQSALAQFSQPEVTVVVKSGVRSRASALKIVKSTAAEGGILCHTLVEPEVREAVARECHLKEVVAIDLLGPTINLLNDHLEEAPQNQPGLSYELNREQFDRLDAVDFTMAHDDGARVRDLKKAEVVLVGVSRVSKSVTCFYLASRGIRAANYPLTPVHTVPPELTRLDSRRVIGLTMNAARLGAIREARLERITNRPVDGYAEQRDVAAELRRATEVMLQNGWRRLDVSYKATEEVAGEIIDMLPRRRVSTKARTRRKVNG